MNQRPSSRAMWRMVPLDFVFVLLVPVLIATTLGLTNAVEVALAGFVISLTRHSAYILWMRSTLAPVDDWARATARERDDERLRRALATLETTPARFLWLYCASWVLAIGGTLLYAYLSTAGPLGLGPRFAIVAALMVLTIVLGAGVLAYTLSNSVLRVTALPILVEAQKRGLSVARAGTPLRPRIALLAIAIAVTPIGWLGAIGLRAAETSAEREAGLVAEREALAAVHRAERGGSLAQGAGGVRALWLAQAEAELGSARDWARVSAREGGVRVEPGSERALAVATAADGRALVAIVPISADRTYIFLIAVAGFLVAVAVWAPISAFGFGTDIAQGIGLITQAAQRVVDVGDLRQMDPLPVVDDDELGELTRHFNELVDGLRALADRAESVAAGDLTVSKELTGDLAEAFGGMLDSLRTLVSQIRETSVQLASAAAEIYSASQEQEAAATQQSAAITEVSQTMDSLATSAGHISDSAGAVLGDAERTRSTTDQMAARITELNAHAGRIGDLLEVIREVADRSDLLALNGSLEATRAGESGRGFGLVAGEMRRLAERVTATVESVRGLIGDVRASGAATVMATDQSRKLAERTTDTARRITLVTQQQRTATEQ
ncbi:MAG: methyl-accepting chemotaxis protein, partial [Sandaracinaceae bacterium]|nr:methyl-accepting chemotaxis protein [Sandaracinaceae bacterium]